VQSSNASASSPSPAIALSELAHELRTPLTYLCGAIDLLEMETEDQGTPRIGAILAQMRQSLWGMVRLLDNAVLYEEFAQDNFQQPIVLHPQTVELKQFCQKLLVEIVPPAQLPLVKTQWGPGDIVLEVDRELLRTLLGNLIANAVRFSTLEQPIQLSIDRSAAGVTLCIRDWGIGIPPTEQAEIGQPFFRASNASRLPGLGLGFSLAKFCARSLQSQLTLRSQLGEGCVVTWFLPRG
jgi:signal transduction histidine kinase